MPSPTPPAGLARRPATRIDAHAVSVWPTDTRADVAAFGREVGIPGFSVMLDRARRTTLSRLGAPEAGSVIIYDRRGRIVTHLTTPGTAQLRAAMREVVSAP